jgi:hypothetical protein
MTDNFTIKLNRAPSATNHPATVTLQPSDYTALLAKGIAGITDPELAAELKALGGPSTGT